MSSSVLYERLGELVAARLVRQNEARDYELTDFGHEVDDAIEPLGKWAERWAATLSNSALDGHATLNGLETTETAEERDELHELGEPSIP